MRKFGERLRQAAKTAGHTGDADAARAAEVEIRAYGNYVNGRVPKDPEVLSRICRAFGTTPNILFGFESPDYQQEAAAIAERMNAEKIGGYGFNMATALLGSRRTHQSDVGAGPPNPVRKILLLIERAFHTPPKDDVGS